MQKFAICAVRTIAQFCQAISLQLRRVSSQYGELQPTNDSDWLVSLGRLSKFQEVLCLDFVTAATSLNRGQPHFAQCLAIFWVVTIYYILHFLGPLHRNRILPGAKFSLRPSLALSYIGSITARHSSSGCQRNFVSVQQRRHLY